MSDWQKTGAETGQDIVICAESILKIKGSVSNSFYLGAIDISASLAAGMRLILGGLLDNSIAVRGKLELSYTFCWELLSHTWNFGASKTAAATTQAIAAGIGAHAARVQQIGAEFDNAVSEMDNKVSMSDLTAAADTKIAGLNNSIGVMKNETTTALTEANGSAQQVVQKHKVIIGPATRAASSLKYQCGVLSRMAATATQTVGASSGSGGAKVENGALISE